MSDNPVLATGLGSARYLNRELSTMAFNARVLDIAGDKRRPLLERAKFIAIFATNNDEFFQKRGGGRPHVPQRPAAGRDGSAVPFRLPRQSGPAWCGQRFFNA